MKGKLRTIYKRMICIGICLTLIGVIPVAAQANVPNKGIHHQETQYPSSIDEENRADGTISGKVTCLGFISDNATNEVYVDLHTDVTSPPVDTIHISCNQTYQFLNVLDGTYYIGSWLDENDSEGGPPDTGEPHVWYGNQEPIVISPTTPSQTDVDLELARYIERVSLFSGDMDLEEKEWASYEPSISGDGRYVVFSTFDMMAYIFRGVHIFDRELNETTQFSTNDYTSGTFYAPDISADGDFIAATYMDETSYPDVARLMIKEWKADPENLVVISPPVDNSLYFDSPSISADGCRVAFEFTYEDASEIEFSDIYLYDCNTQDTTLISVALNETDPGNKQSHDPAISDDGLFVVFKSRATDLVDPPPTITGNLIYVRDIEAGTTELVPLPEGISGDDFFFDPPSISADGRYIAFEYNYEVFVHDRETGETKMISLINGEPSGFSEDPSISGDGRFVTYTTYRKGENEDWFVDIYVKDLETGTLKLATKGLDGVPNLYYEYPVISANGRYVAFQSAAKDLVVNDNNGTTDVFVYMNAPALTVDILGSGSVIKDPDQSTYTFDEIVTLIPVPDEGYAFDGWTGADAADLVDNDDGTWSITMDDDKNITANFNLDILNIYLPMILK